MHHGKQTILIVERNKQEAEHDTLHMLSDRLSDGQVRVVRLAIVMRVKCERNLEIRRVALCTCVNIDVDRPLHVWMRSEWREKGTVDKRWVVWQRSPCTEYHITTGHLTIILSIFKCPRIPSHIGSSIPQTVVFSVDFS
ncbi:hypothetical protein CBL_09085 [Carabus blaptoides fortunei]